MKNYEINDPLHPLYGRTRSMSIEYLVAFADFYDVSVEYLLGLSNSRKQEYHDISEQLGLCDGAIKELIQCKENSGSEEDPKMYAQQDTVILNDFLTSMEFERREQDAEKLEEARLLMNKYGYFPVENDVISQVHMENAIGIVSSYLRKLPKRLYDEFRKR